MAGSAALTLAIYHPDQFPYAASLSGFLNLSEGWWPMLVNTSMGDAGGYKSDDMWGPSERSGVEAQRPDGQHRDAGLQQHPDVDLLRRRHPVGSGAGNNMPAAKFLEGFTLRTNKTFQTNYIAAGGKNAVFNFPQAGTHSWGYWGSAVAADEARHPAGARRDAG